MAVGFPAKVSYANGDVFSASDINDTNGTLNLLTSSTLSSQAGKNPVINGGFDVWQRGTSVAGGNNSTTFCADRWNAYRGTAGSTFSRQVTGDTTNLPNIQYCLRVARDNANTGTGVIITSTSVETINSIPYAGQTVTVSFYARRGANYSSTSNLINYQLSTGTGTDQNILLPYTGAVNTTGTKTLTTTWQRFTFTATLGATATEVGLAFSFTPTGTAGAADYFELAAVQLELGSVATTFTRTGSSIGAELLLCQRYFEVMANGAEMSTLEQFGTLQCYSTVNCFGSIPFKVTKRVAATGTISSASHFQVRTANAAQVTLTAFTTSSTANTTRMLNLNGTTSASLSVGAATIIECINASGLLTASAEL